MNGFNYPAFNSGGFDDDFTALGLTESGQTGPPLVYIDEKPADSIYSKSRGAVRLPVVRLDAGAVAPEPEPASAGTGIKTLLASGGASGEINLSGGTLLLVALGLFLLLKK